MISQKGIDLIKRWEGCKLSAYQCPAGVWTIGYGHTANVKAGQTITQEQAEEYLKADIKVFNDSVMELSEAYHWNQNQIDALTSFTYNLGTANLNKLVNGRDNVTIAEKMLLYVNAGGVKLQGLVNRRTAERALFLEPMEETDIPYDVDGETLAQARQYLTIAIDALMNMRDIL